MRNDQIIAEVSRDELKLIVSALSAYQHNHSYRAVYEKFLDKLAARKCAGFKHCPKATASCP